MTRKYLITVGVFGFLSIFFGAVLSHFITGKLTPEHLYQYNTGVQYMMFHTLALLGFAFMHKNISGTHLNVIFTLFFIGIFFFSFGMLIQATSKWTDLSLGFMSFIIPFGAVSFMAGWLYVLWMALAGKYKRKHNHKNKQSHDNQTL